MSRRSSILCSSILTNIFWKILWKNIFFYFSKISNILWFFACLLFTGFYIYLVLLFYARLFPTPKLLVYLKKLLYKLRLKISYFVSKLQLMQKVLTCKIKNEPLQCYILRVFFEVFFVIFEFFVHVTFCWENQTQTISI